MNSDRQQQYELHLKKLRHSMRSMLSAGNVYQMRTRLLLTKSGGFQKCSTATLNTGYSLIAKYISDSRTIKINMGSFL